MTKYLVTESRKNKVTGEVAGVDIFILDKGRLRHVIELQWNPEYQIKPSTIDAICALLEQIDNEKQA